MAKLFIEETTLTAIGDAIRGKEGTTALVPVTDMATRITNLPSGGGGGNEPTDEELVVTGDCPYKFSGWGWFINKYGNRITTKDISQANYMFSSSADITSIPFQINVTNCANFTYLFAGCEGLKEPPKVRGSIKWNSTTNFGSMLSYCSNLRNLDEVFTPDMLDEYSAYKVTSATSVPKVTNFSNCKSLRTVPIWWYKFRLNPESTVYVSTSYALYNSAFSGCFSLDEALNIPVWKCKGAATNNLFNGIVSWCFRLKDFTFETNPDGSPIVTEWKSQTIDLSNGTGYIESGYHYTQITNVNSGITTDKGVGSDATYQALKDDPDWFTNSIGYSRYDKASAVRTINSLPDTSAYLATAGGTNTIKFRGNAGSKTDGGAINTLTAEEIAVATAKGWTVTFA